LKYLLWCDQSFITYFSTDKVIMCETDGILEF
jgi:hypothetical protein